MFKSSTWWNLLPLASWDRSLLLDLDQSLELGPAGQALEHAISARIYPRAAIEHLGDLGLWRVFMPSPEEDDCCATFWHLTSVAVLTAQRSASLAISVGINGLALLPLYIAGDSAQVEHWRPRILAGAGAAMGLSEWDHGSDLTANETTAEPIDDHYVLRGEKRPINQASEAGVITVLARTSRPPTTSLSGPAAGLSIFMLERDDTVESLERIVTLPTTSADISGFAFHGTRLRRSARIGREGDGFSLAMKALTFSRGGISAFPSGSTTLGLDIATKHATTRSLYGRPIVDLPAIHQHLLHCAAYELATNCLAIKACALSNAYGQRAAYYTAMAKYICSEMGEAAITEGRHILAARALIDGPFSRLVADIVLFGAFDGTRHVVLDGLRGRVKQMFLRKENDRAGQEEIINAYCVPPRPIFEAVRMKGRPLIVGPEIVSKSHQATGGVLNVAPLVEVSECLASLARAAISDRHWQSQTVAFAILDGLARLEACFAVLELADKERRAIAGMCDLVDPYGGRGPLSVEQVASEALVVLGQQTATSVLKLASQLGLAHIAQRSADVISDFAKADSK